jgi:ribonuclease HII
MRAQRIVATPSLPPEVAAVVEGYAWVAGVDEAGRGPLAGPVVAAAVILPKDAHIPGVNDSKQLSASQRENAYEEIIEAALAYRVAQIEPRIIDEINILQASRLAMREAVAGLTLKPDFALIDGLPVPDFPVDSLSVVKGDATCFPIAAASILAKVERDRRMLEYHGAYPNYGFDRHKGYPTADHLRRLREFGPCEIHRRSFGPVRKILGERSGG